MREANPPEQQSLPLFRSDPLTAKGVAPERVRVGAQWIEFGYRRSVRRRTVGVEVHPDGSVVVAAPPYVAVAELRRLVAQRAEWIGKWRSRFAALPRPASGAPRPGTRHPYLGKRLALRLEPAINSSVTVVAGALRVRTPSVDDLAAVQGLLDAWYRREAERLLPQRFAQGWQRFAGAGRPPPRLTLRQMKTRWGSCSPKGRITLNTELIKTPPACIDYVVLHELCHLRVPNHSPRFWALVEQRMPDYRQLRRQLNGLATQAG